MVAAGELRVACVQEDHEHPRAGVLGLRAHLGDVVGVAAPLDRRVAGDVDALEGLDLLRDAIFEHLEIGRREIGDGLAVSGGIDVDADEVGVQTEGRALRLLRGRSGRLALDGGGASQSRHKRDSQEASTHWRGLEEFHRVRLAEAALWHGKAESITSRIGGGMPE